MIEYCSRVNTILTENRVCNANPRGMVLIKSIIHFHHRYSLLLVALSCPLAQHCLTLIFDRLLCHNIMIQYFWHMDISYFWLPGWWALRLSWAWWRHQMGIFSALLTLCVVTFPHKNQWCGVLMFSLICAWTNGWVHSPDADDLRHHRAYYDVTVMVITRRMQQCLNVIYIVFTKYFLFL